jgi:hypothetical protein
MPMYEKPKKSSTVSWVFSQLVDAHRNFTQGMLGAITGADRSSETARDMLTRYLAQVRTVADYYRALWSKPV